MKRRDRFGAVEYDKHSPLVADIASRRGLSHTQARDLLYGAGERVRSALGLDSSPLSWSGDLLRFENVAGLLLLAPGIEVEIAPKFLGNTEGWREDFFLLATLDHHGRLLDEQGIRASASASSDLFTLIGRSFVEMYWRNHRRPLRIYRRHSVTDFALDGNFDAADLRMSGEDGFDQDLTTFTRSNPFNAVIAAAATRLAPLVSDPETRARLERVGQHLPRQSLPLRIEARTLPSRAKGWQSTYDLAVDILNSLGGSYDPRSAIAPGFVLKTWQAWESLVTAGLRSAFGTTNVSPQAPRKLGDRKLVGGGRKAVEVRPDNLVAHGGQVIVVDAKYKGNIAYGPTEVSSADLYEGLAFARAASAREVILAYPARVAASGNASDSFAGGYRQFSQIEVGDVTVRGVEFGVRGISRPHGLRSFSRALSAYIAETLPARATDIA